MLFLSCEKEYLKQWLKVSNQELEHGHDFMIGNQLETVDNKIWRRSLQEMCYHIYSLRF